METESSPSSSSKWVDYLVPVLLVVGFGLLIYWWFKPAPDLSGTRVEEIVLEPFWMPPGEEGATKTVADLKGKYTLLSFWATWCGPCRAELPYLGAIAEHFRDDPEFQIWTVLWECPPNEKTKATVSSLFKQNGVALPVYVYSDPPKPAMLEPEGVPIVFLIGPDGKIADQWSGRNDNLEKEVVELVGKLKEQ